MRCSARCLKTSSPQIRHGNPPPACNNREQNKCHVKDAAAASASPTCRTLGHPNQRPRSRRSGTSADGTLTVFSMWPSWTRNSVVSARDDAQRPQPGDGNSRQVFAGTRGIRVPHPQQTRVLQRPPARRNPELKTPPAASFGARVAALFFDRGGRHLSGVSGGVGGVQFSQPGQTFFSQFSRLTRGRPVWRGRVEKERKVSFNRGHRGMGILVFPSQRSFLPRGRGQGFEAPMGEGQSFSVIGGFEAGPLRSKPGDGAEFLSAGAPRGSDAGRSQFRADRDAKLRLCLRRPLARMPFLDAGSGGPRLLRWHSDSGACMRVQSLETPVFAGLTSYS